MVLDVDPTDRVIHAHHAAGMTDFAAGARFSRDAVPWLQFDVNAVFADLDEYGL